MSCRGQPLRRIDAIAAQARGPCLHIGCVGSQENGERWVHGELSRSATPCVGVDNDLNGLRRVAISEHIVGALVCADALALPFQEESFATVVAAEIIEHVGNPERLLRECARVIRVHGYVLVTTPNPFCVEWILKARRGLRAGWDPGHLGWFDPETLARLAARACLSAVQLVWVENDEPDPWRIPLRYHFYRRVLTLLRGVIPQYLANQCFLLSLERNEPASGC